MTRDRKLYRHGAPRARRLYNVRGYLSARLVLITLLALACAFAAFFILRRSGYLKTDPLQAPPPLATPQTTPNIPLPPSDNNPVSLPPRGLSSLTAAAHRPRIAASPQGDCIVAWQQTMPPLIPDFPSATAAIVARERRNGSWGKVTNLSSLQPATELHYPTVTMDSHATPLVLWRARDKHSTRLEYTYRNNDGSWRPPKTLGQRSELRILTPAVATLPARERDDWFFAWIERNGLHTYRVHAHVITASGEEFADIPAGREELLNVEHPRFFRLPPRSPGEPPRMALCWLDKQESTDLHLETRVWNRAKRLWEKMNQPPVWNPKLIPFKPAVQVTPRQGPTLVGYMRAGVTKRIFISSRSHPLAFLDTPPLADDFYPSLSPPFGERLGAIWLEQDDAGASATLAQAVFDLDRGRWGAMPLARGLRSCFYYDVDVALTDKRLLAVWIGPEEAPVASPATGRRRQFPARSVYFSDTSQDSPQLQWRAISSAAKEPLP